MSASVPLALAGCLGGQGDGSSTTTVTVDASAPAADGASEFDATVNWGADTATRTVAYE